MMSKKYIVILVFTAITLIAQNDNKFQWKKIYSGSDIQINLVSGESKNDFFVETASGKLLRIVNGEIKEVLSPPSSIDFIEAHYYKISENDFFCSIITNEWKGEVYRVKKNIWKKYDISTIAPIRYFYKTSKELYLTGDFGILLKFTHNTWEKINTPFKSHIVSATTDSNIIYFATQNNGLVKFDGENFSFLSKNSIEKNLLSVKIIDNTIYAITNNYKILKFSKGNIENCNNKEILKYFILQNSSIFGFIEKNIYFNKKTIKISFPQSFNILEARKGTENISILKDSSILLFSKDGKIYINKKSENSFFTDLATIYRVNDLPNSYNTGTSFFDANNDGINDLILFSRNFGNYLTFYQGVKNSPFANITSISNLPFKARKIFHYTISDFNGDYKKDLILESRVDSLHKILLYKNLGDFRFTKVNEILLPNEFQNMGIRDLSTFDYDLDGDDDLIVTSYYGSGNSPGYILIYKNNYWGNFNEIDTTFKSFTRRWNQKFMFADISNNDTLDIFSATFWKNDHLLFGTDSGYVDKTKTHFPIQENYETTNTLLSDFDNDGDLDIITSGSNDFIHVYSNNGSGYFSDITNILFKNFLDRIKNYRTITDLNIGDFNNDSYVDILATLRFSDTSYTTIFINNSGKSFVESPLNLEQDQKFTSSSLSDFDNDGDLDIYGTTDKQNVLLVNRLDNKNFVKITLHGVISSTSALGSKVWIYKAGKLDDNNFLIGYKQLGTDAYKNNRINDLTLHFGLGNIKECDIKIKFLSQRVINLRNVKAGSTLSIDELPFIYAAIYNLPGNIYRLMTNKRNQLYILLFLISHFILGLGLWYGFTKLRWSIKITFTFTALNLSLFWLSVYFSSLSQNNYFIFLIPLGITIIITLIPIVLFTWFNRTSQKSSFIYNDKLLELIMTFSHGEWALRNLNSIILLCENPPTNWETNDEFKSKLLVRLNTFAEMTISSITEIINYEKLLGNINEELNNLEKTSAEIIKNINPFLKDKQLPNLQTLTDNFTSIRYYIKELKNIVYSRFSCEPTKVINNLISNYENDLKVSSITIKKTKQFPNEVPVLIRNYELGNILDNLLQNSLRFMKNSAKKEITIELYKESPKIILKFSNTGTPIPPNKWESIFNQGYSESNSTGQGLFSAREILKKYGGRIFVEQSNFEITTFKIELNEGVTLS